MQRRSLVIRSIYAMCLLLAGANHALILARHGILWDYWGVPWPSAVYWTSLTLVDPLVALTLFARPRAGILCTVVLIWTNVLHNLGISAWRVPTGELASFLLSSPILLTQIGFGLFVAATARAAWIGAPPRAERT